MRGFDDRSPTDAHWFIDERGALFARRCVRPDCPYRCVKPVVVTLLPGEQVETYWSGLFVEHVELPLQCVPSGSTLKCDRARHAQPGIFTFSAQAGTERDCLQTTGDPCAPCEPGGSGCLTFDAVIGGERMAATSQVYLDASYGVWPDDPTAEEPRPRAAVASATEAVRLIFRE